MTNLNFLIIGCGQLGAKLANTLDSLNHEVSVIASEKALTENLSENFSGISISGSPIDSDIMKSAGIEGCDYVICATESDNSNIMAAQVIKNVFNIKNVFVRVLDPIKCEIYKEMGLLTISPTSIVFETIFSKIFSCEENKIINCGKSLVKILTVPYEKWMKRKTLSEVLNINNHKLIGFLDENDIFKTYDEENHNLKIEKKHKLIYIEILN